MNVELKFKPGVRTSLNSNNSIRDTFGSGNNQNGVNKTRNSAANSAAKNLSQMTLVSGDWNSKSGSVLTVNHTSSRHVTQKSAQQRRTIDPNFVSAGRSQAYVRDRYSTIQDFGYSRAENMSGYSGRGLQRLHDAAYGMGAYAELNALHTQTNNGMDAITTATMAVKTGKDLFDLGKGIWDTFSSKDSKVSGGNVSETATKNIKAMKDAKDSVALGSSITEAKTAKESAESSIPTMKESLSKAESEKTELETKLTESTNAYNDLTGKISEKTSSVNQLTTTVSSLETAYSAKESEVNAMPEGTDEQKAAKAKAKAELATKKSELEAKKAELKTAQDELNTLKKQEPELKGKMNDAQKAVNANKKTIDETPAKIKNAEATIETYKKEIPKQEKRLEEMQKKEDKEFEKLYNDGVKNKNNDKDKAKLNDLAKTIAQRDTKENKFEEINGKCFAEISGADGKKFLIDGKVVTEEEFKAAKEEV